MMPPLAREPGLHKSAALWLLLLAPLFFATYGFATWVTGQRSDVGTLVFEWETAMPFWAWSIVPYWTIDLFYGASLLVPNSRHALKRHALRLISAQLTAVACFLLWPLRFTFARPELDGVFGWLFALLANFDQPFNQAPSLHIALLVILWDLYQRHARGVWRWAVHGWFALIAVSVLTTYQHHFIDVPTGALLGWLCVWLWPLDGPAPFSRLRTSSKARHWRPSLVYAAGALLLGLPAVFGGTWLWLLWPATALMMVALNYALVGPGGFQKTRHGQLSLAARWLLAPYISAASINAWLWTRRHPQPDEVMDDVWLGRLPDARQLARFSAVIDLCAELPFAPHGRAYLSIPVLDLTLPSREQCLAAAQAIEHMRHEGPVLVCCALGYSRSATAVAAWLLHSGRAHSVAAAITLVRIARPQVVLHRGHLQLLKDFHGR